MEYLLEFEKASASLTKHAEQPTIAYTEPPLQASAPDSPLLRLPPELRLKILRYVIQDALVTHQDQNFIVIEDLPWRKFNKPQILNVFLINRLLHDEAEEALWKGFPLVLDAFYHFKYPIRPSPAFHLSIFAYSAIKTLHLPLHICRHTSFSSIRTDHNVILGDEFSTTPLGGTWRFDKVARQLTNLKLLCVAVFEGEDMLRRGGFRKRSVEAIVGILGMFPAEEIIILCGNPLLRQDLVKEARYRIKDYKKICNWKIGELSRWNPDAASSMEVKPRMDSLGMGYRSRAREPCKDNGGQVAVAIPATRVKVRFLDNILRKWGVS